MLTDAHCHPFDLMQVFPEAEAERRRLGVLAAASAYSPEDFSHNEKLSLDAAAENSAPVFPCFGIHPQFLSQENSKNGSSITNLLNLLDTLASEKRISAIGECGFDLYSEEYKETEEQQEIVFNAHLETAVKYGLPIVLHVRRAMHKIFPSARQLAKCKAVVFHTWPGTYDEALSLLRHGINAYFSFGNIIMLNHKKAIKSCALLPADRILTETDAPYAPRRDMNFSCYADLPLILKAASELRNENIKELETQIENNFLKVFEAFARFF